MSKRELKSYLKELNKQQLEEQIFELYDRFKDVKEYYNFAFNPNESKLIDESKFKISKEYFPVNMRKPKMRRSVAQKFIKHFIRLGVDTVIITDIMLFNIEIAQTYSKENFIKQESFYKSMLKSFCEAVDYIFDNGLAPQYTERIEKIADEAQNQNWFNYRAFDNHLESKVDF